MVKGIDYLVIDKDMPDNLEGLQKAQSEMQQKTEEQSNALTTLLREQPL